jgi:phage replication-related protein YjqB (UPF0714/DUF867 family)
LGRLLLYHDYCTPVVSEHTKMCFGLTRTEQKAPDEVQGHFRTVGHHCTGRHVTLTGAQDCEAVTRFSENLWAAGLSDFANASHPFHSVTPNAVVQMAALQLSIQVVRVSNFPTHRLYRFVPSASPGKCRNINSSQATTNSYV